MQGRELQGLSGTRARTKTLTSGTKGPWQGATALTLVWLMGWRIVAPEEVGVEPAGSLEVAARRCSRSGTTAGALFPVALLVLRSPRNVRILEQQACASVLVARTNMHEKARNSRDNGTQDKHLTVRSKTVRYELYVPKLTCHVFMLGSPLISGIKLTQSRRNSAMNTVPYTLPARCFYA